MSDLIGQKTGCRSHIDNPCSAIRMLLQPQEKDLGDVTVRRLMPTLDLPAVGPFVFFDHLGPARFPAGRGIDIRPHPHIGLATVTYVFEGEILHRDSLGRVQSIRPNQINWMTAGRGIVHSERTPPELRARGHRLHALQLWVALPEADQETEPEFIHYGDQDLPLLEEPGRSMRVMIGEAFGLRSAVRTWSPTLYVEVNLQAGNSIVVPDLVEERAVYVVSGELAAGEQPIPQHSMAVFDTTAGIELTARQDSRLVVIGGTPLGKRTVWWNLVSSRRALIEKAKQDWREHRFPNVPGETEFIPLPE
jgi:hypothetical protein